MVIPEPCKENRKAEFRNYFRLGLPLTNLHLGFEDVAQVRIEDL